MKTIDHDAPDHDRAYCMTCDNLSDEQRARWVPQIASALSSPKLPPEHAVNLWEGTARRVLDSPEFTALVAEQVEAARAGHRDLVSRLGFGDNITEPMAGNDTIVAFYEELSSEASEWRESQAWRNDCAAAGHPDDQDCFEHDPQFAVEAAERALVEKLEAASVRPSPEDMSNAEGEAWDALHDDSDIICTCDGCNYYSPTYDGDHECALNIYIEAIVLARVRGALRAVLAAVHPATKSEGDNS